MWVDDTPKNNFPRHPGSTCYPLQIFPFDVEAVVPADVITLALDAEVQDRDDLDGFVAKRC